MLCPKCLVYLTAVLALARMESMKREMPEAGAWRTLNIFRVGREGELTEFMADE